MTRLRPGTLAGIVIAALVLAAACGLFAVQYSQAYAQCSSLPGASPCSAVSPPGQAVSAVFVAIAGLLVAIVMAITAGINSRVDAAPNSALARQLEAEDAAYKRARERFEELKELNRLALAHAQPSPDLTEAAAETTEVEMSDHEMSVSEILSGGPAIRGSDGQWEEQKHVETEEERRKRLVVDRMRSLARNKPEAVADVLRDWIDQPRLPSR
jgi:flagellar biosynthesis/type III secretory pathway M-ring protein FliF/YscJ